MADGKDGAVVRPIIVKKIKKIAGGHHGGAWKVAYADFVTAMMAFFLLLWLLNVSTKEQLNALSDYFDPTKPIVSSDTGGAGGVLGGMSVSPEGNQSTDVQTLAPDKPLELQQKEAQEELDRQALEEQMRKLEEERFEEAKQKILEEIQKSPELAQLEKNLMIDMTPEGLRIQIVDQEGASMFPSGSAKMFEKTKKLLEMVTGVIQKLPNQISVRGHTDSVPYGAGADYTNWELSSDRANASRRVILGAGLPEKRIQNVVGRADTDHLIPDKPLDPKNRRISIILLREDLVKQEKTMDGKTGTSTTRPAPFKKTQGSVYFP